MATQAALPLVFFWLKWIGTPLFPCVNNMHNVNNSFAMSVAGCLILLIFTVDVALSSPCRVLPTFPPFVSYYLRKNKRCAFIQVHLDMRHIPWAFFQMETNCSVFCHEKKQNRWSIIISFKFAFKTISGDATFWICRDLQSFWWERW